MDNDTYEEPKEYPLRPDPPFAAQTRARGENLRRVRHVSNWSLAALVVGVGAASAAIAYAAPGRSNSGVTTVNGTTVGTTTTGKTTGSGPTVCKPVAVTSGSQVVTVNSCSTPGSTGTGSTPLPATTYPSQGGGDS